MKIGALVLLPALLVSLACDAGGASDKSATAIATVSREVTSSNPAGISSSDLAATPIPRGNGVVVYVKNRKAPEVRVRRPGWTGVCVQQPDEECHAGRAVHI